MLSEFFSGKQLNKSINPEEAIAYGAAVQAAIMTEEGGDRVRNLLLIDVTPLSFGIETGDGVMTKIIEGNSSLPIIKEEIISLNLENQTSVTFKVFEGESQMTKNNHFIGSFTLDGLQPSTNTTGTTEIVV